MTLPLESIAASIGACPSWVALFGDIEDDGVAETAADAIHIYGLLPDEGDTPFEGTIAVIDGQALSVLRNSAFGYYCSGSCVLKIYVVFRQLDEEGAYEAEDWAAERILADQLMFDLGKEAIIKSAAAGATGIRSIVWAQPAQAPEENDIPYWKLEAVIQWPGDA